MCFAIQTKPHTVNKSIECCFELRGNLSKGLRLGKEPLTVFKDRLHDAFLPVLQLPLLRFFACRVLVG